VGVVGMFLGANQKEKAMTQAGWPKNVFFFFCLLLRSLFSFLFVFSLSSR
jgi:hypothetical protein